ncbi:MAG: aldolase/citrate lyase family protein [Bryobacteraceae bacterium]|jgi:4-hydroxy-2-oxoheptanedioate aldolase
MSVMRQTLPTFRERLAGDGSVRGRSSGRDDVVFVGPCDLSQSLGVPGQVGDPRVASTVESIAVTCRARGRHAGVFVDSIAAARKYRSLGVKYIAYSVDVGIFADAYAELRAALHDPVRNGSNE